MESLPRDCAHVLQALWDADLAVARAYDERLVAAAE